MSSRLAVELGADAVEDGGAPVAADDDEFGIVEGDERGEDVAYRGCESCSDSFAAFGCGVDRSQKPFGVDGARAGSS